MVAVEIPHLYCDEALAIFNAGAVGASWVLHADPAFAALLGNVLAHFGIPVPDQVDCRCVRGPTTALVKDD